MQPSSSYHYNKHSLPTNNAENSSNSAHRPLSNTSTRAASWTQSGVQSSQSNALNNYLPQQHQQPYSSQQQHSQQSQSSAQQLQQQTWKRSYQKYLSHSSQLAAAVQIPDRSTSPPSPKFIAFTDTDGGSPPSQRYKSSSSGVMNFQPPSLHSPIISKIRHSGNTNNYNGNSMNDLEDGELT